MVEVIIECALALEKSLGMTVVVDGIGTEQQHARLAFKAPDLLQGFLFGYPGVITAHLADPVNVVHLPKHQNHSLQFVNHILVRPTQISTCFECDIVSCLFVDNLSLRQRRSLQLQHLGLM